jgi:hypothetical protein
VVETTIRRRRRPFKRPGAHASALLLWAAFVVVFVLLAVQMKSQPKPEPEAPVLVRRIVVTKVVHDAPAASASAPAPAAAPPAPAPAAPAPAPVAPAPAPVTTQSS